MAHSDHLFLLAISLIITIAGAHNITAILAGFPEYSQFNSYLTQTKLCDEIDSRNTITVLVLNNGEMDTLTAKRPLSVIKNLLSLHIILDYYDAKKLHKIEDGTVSATTLYQTTGNAPGNVGFVNISDMRGGRVGFGSGEGGKLDSSYKKEVKTFPYNLAVVEISAPIIAPSLLTAVGMDGNITTLLEKAGCKTFARLISSTGVLKVFEAAAARGLTIFAPNDKAFTDPAVPDLTKLTNAEQVSLLQYHALASYNPYGSLKTTKVPTSTLATNGAGKYDLTVTTAGDEVTLHSDGKSKSRVAKNVVDVPPMVVFTVDNVLLPIELFGKPPSPAPAPGPVSPAPEKHAPSPAPVLNAPTPSPFSSPPAPPGSSPSESPAPTDGPADSASSTSDEASSTSDEASGYLIEPAEMMVVLVVVIMSVLLG